MSEDQETEIDDLEACEFCDMDGSPANNYHIIGCPNGWMS